MGGFQLFRNHPFQSRRREVGATGKRATQGAIVNLAARIPYTLTPAARMREAERLRVMARRAWLLPDDTPAGLSRDEYAMRLERQAAAQHALTLKH